MRAVFKLIEGNELDNVRRHILAVGRRVEGLFVAIKHLHRSEVSIADTHDDYGHRQLGAAHDFVNRLLHIVNHTIGQDQQNVELLSVLRYIGRLGVCIGLLENLAEVGWAVKRTRVEGGLVVRNHLLNAVDARIKDITVKGEAMRGALVERRDRSAKAVQVDHLVAVVELKDVTDAFDGLQVLIASRVKVMERGGLARIAVGEGEVDCHGQINLATAKDILEEGVLRFDLKLVEIEVTGLLRDYVRGSSFFQHS